MAAFLPFIAILVPYIPERQRHSRAREELGLHEEVEAGCFLTGHPQIQEPVGTTTLGFGEERIFLFGTRAAPLGSVSYASIVSVCVESHTAVFARFTQERMMRLGHRFLAFRAREASDGSYVVVEWKDDKRQRHDGIFGFEGLAADVRARRCRDAILHYAALHRRALGGPALEPFAHQFEEFEIRRCEHCGKMHRPATPLGEKSAA